FYAGAPPSTNYLATHWNTANSVFLAGANGTPPATVPPSNTAPTPPQNLVATAPATGGVKLTWQAPASNGGSAVTGYNVFRRTATGSYVLVKVLSAGTRNWRDQTTASGTAYVYEVVAKNVVGSSAPSEAGATTH
ncbi:MAG: fibronectin type III domain-containing protein, partial [Acidimicrobiia bacterium]|nr:fibronectin type III domain-containing protein [Acidimicrobiia bacterium]